MHHVYKYPLYMLYTIDEHDIDLNDSIASCHFVDVLPGAFNGNSFGFWRSSRFL